MTMIRSGFILIATLLLASTSHAENAAHDIADIQHVIDTFHRAVTIHDGAALSALFIPQGSTWLNVLSDDAYRRAQAKSPTVARIRVGSYKDFAGFVSTSKDTLNPQRSHLRIYTNGTIASAYFDFVFLINGKVENRGSETWQLVKGGEGWRIAALTYSSDPPL